MSEPLKRGDRVIIVVGHVHERHGVEVDRAVAIREALEAHGIEVIHVMRDDRAVGAQVVAVIRPSQSREEVEHEVMWGYRRNAGVALPREASDDLRRF